MNDAIGGISNVPPSTNDDSIPLPPPVISTAPVITDPPPFHYLKLFVSSLSYQIFLILVILLHLLHIYHLFTIFMSLSPMKRLLLIPIGNKLWLRNFLLYIKQILGIWCHFHLVRALLVLIRFIKSKEI